MLTDEQILEIAEKHHASHPGVDEWWEFRDRDDVVAFGRAILASAGQAEPQKPIATLHDDGHWTWKPGMRMHECNQAGWWMDVYAAPTPAAAQTTYSSTQATNCAVCGEHKHTPLRIDWMGGYVCLTCIDKQLESRGEQPAAAQDERGAFEKAIDKLIYTAWYSGEQDGSEGVKWSEIGDSYNSMLRSRINDDKKALLALIARATAAPESKPDQETSQDGRGAAGATPTPEQVCAIGACASLAEVNGNHEIAQHVRAFLLEIERIDRDAAKGGSDANA